MLCLRILITFIESGIELRSEQLKEVQFEKKKKKKKKDPPVQVEYKPHACYYIHALVEWYTNTRRVFGFFKATTNKHRLSLTHANRQPLEALIVKIKNEAQLSLFQVPIRGQGFDIAAD